MTVVDLCARCEYGRSVSSARPNARQLARGLLLFRPVGVAFLGRRRISFGTLQRSRQPCRNTLTTQPVWALCPQVPPQKWGPRSASPSWFERACQRTPWRLAMPHCRSQPKVQGAAPFLTPSECRQFWLLPSARARARSGQPNTHHTVPFASLCVGPQGGMSLTSHHPLAVTDGETISGLCVENKGNGRMGDLGPWHRTKVDPYMCSAGRLPQNSTGPHPEFPILTPLHPVKRPGRVWSGLVELACSSPWPRPGPAPT